MTTQATQTTATFWSQDADELEAQVKAAQFMLGTTLSNELTYQLRHAVMNIDSTNAMVISYAVTVRNLAKYTIEDVQANRDVLQTLPQASIELAKAVDKRKQAIDALELLLTIAMPIPANADAYIRNDIKDHRLALAQMVCNNSALRMRQA